MGAFIENGKLIIDDLRSSWYFRIWSFFWLFCAVTSFACLILLGERTTEDSHRDIHMFFENSSSITFPRYSIRMLDVENPNGQVISFKSCTHDGALVHTQPCTFGTHDLPPNKCFTVPGDTITTNNVWGDLFGMDNKILCSINTTGADVSGNTLIVWSAEAPSIFGDVESHDIFIAPNSHARVVLDQEIIDTHDHGNIAVWRKELRYHSSVSNQGFYNITTMIGTFRVPHYYEQHSYNAWMGVADAGGFAFFTIILHTIMMMLIGLCLDNDSRFLKGDSGHRPI